MLGGITVYAEDAPEGESEQPESAPPPADDKNNAALEGLVKVMKPVAVCGIITGALAVSVAHPTTTPLMAVGAKVAVDAVLNFEVKKPNSNSEAGDAEVEQLPATEEASEQATVPEVLEENSNAHLLKEMPDGLPLPNVPRRPSWCSIGWGFLTRRSMFDMIWARWLPPEPSNYVGQVRPCNGPAGLGEINDEELDRLDFGIRDFSCDGVWSSSFDTYIFGVTKDVPPTEEDGYIAPKKGPTWDGKNHGWKDKNGNIWVPVPDGSRDAHGGGHWDVQDKLGRGYVNRYPGGKERAGGGKRPSIPKIQISGSNVSSESIETGVRIAGILFGAWVVVKWGAAIALTPETGGTSLVLAGVTP